LPGNNHSSTSTQLVDGYPVTNTGDTGQFDFDLVSSQAIAISKEFSTYVPSLQFNKDDTLDVIDSLTNGYNVITMNICNNNDCIVYLADMMSYTGRIFDDTC
jgi:hypothetical protein